MEFKFKELEAESQQRQREHDAQWDATGHNTNGRLDDEDNSSGEDQPPPRLPVSSVNSCLLTPADGNTDGDTNNSFLGGFLLGAPLTTDKDVPFNPNLGSQLDSVKAEHEHAPHSSFSFPTDPPPSVPQQNMLPARRESATLAATCVVQLGHQQLGGNQMLTTAAAPVADLDGHSARGKHTTYVFTKVNAAPRPALAERLTQLQFEPGQSLSDAKFKIREMQMHLKLETKNVDRDIKRIRTDEAKLQRTMKIEANKGNMQNAQQLANSIARSRYAVAQLEKTKVLLHDVSLKLTTCSATTGVKHAAHVSLEANKSLNGASSMEDISAFVSKFVLEMSHGKQVATGTDEVLGCSIVHDEVTREAQRVLEEVELDMKLLASTMPAANAHAEPSSRRPLIAMAHHGGS
jgi:hypothetical protein